MADNKPKPTPDTPDEGTAENGQPEVEAAGEAASSSPAVDPEQITQTFDRARSELNAAVDRLREEVARLDVSQTREEAATWVKENPTLATFLALGAGLLVGRVLASAFRPEPPPTFTERVRLQAHDLIHQTSDAIRKGALTAGAATAAAGGVLAKKATDLGERAYAEVSELSEEVAGRASDWSHTASERASHLYDQAQHEAADLAKSAKSSTSRGASAAEAALKAAQTAVAAIVVKKVNDLVRSVR